jgi:hypothetical protein
MGQGAAPAGAAGANKPCHAWGPQNKTVGVLDTTFGGFKAGRTPDGPPRWAAGAIPLSAYQTHSRTAGRRTSMQRAAGRREGERTHNTRDVAEAAARHRFRRAVGAAARGLCSVKMILAELKCVRTGATAPRPTAYHAPGLTEKSPARDARVCLPEERRWGVRELSVPAAPWRARAEGGAALQGRRPRLLCGMRGGGRSHHPGLGGIIASRPRKHKKSMPWRERGWCQQQSNPDVVCCGEKVNERRPASSHNARRRAGPCQQTTLPALARIRILWIGQTSVMGLPACGIGRQPRRRGARTAAGAS